MSSCPAHHTKHIPLLIHPFAASTFRLAQLDDGVSNGTALWLGAQCLSLYLAADVFKHSQSGLPPKVVELGSGIGLTALVLSSLGCNVLATDIPHVISTVLTQNIQNNLPQLAPTHGKIQIRELDWTVPPQQWVWDDDVIIAGSSSPIPSSNTNNLLRPPFDLICSADTVYAPSLVGPLLRTLHALSTLSVVAAPASRAPPIYLCIERRDPVLVDRVLSDAKTAWGFNVERIPHRKLAKALAKSGINWDKEDWEGIEIWKLVLRPRTKYIDVSKVFKE